MKTFYQTIFFMYSGDVITRLYDSYPDWDMIEASGIDIEDIKSYETHLTSKFKKNERTRISRHC